jgi:Tfp pilus assembly protein PilO
MFSFLNKLNLTPQERRLVVIVGLIFFVVLNLWLVRPYFKEWNTVQRRKAQAELTLDRYKKTIATIPNLEARLRALEQDGVTFVSEEQRLELERIVQTQSRLHGVTINRIDPKGFQSSQNQTNRFFEEQTLTIDVNTGTEELVNFLVSLASNNSLIRVSSLQLRPLPPNNPTSLSAKISLVASYQKAEPPPATARPRAAASRSDPDMAARQR